MFEQATNLQQTEKELEFSSFYMIMVNNNP